MIYNEGRRLNGFIILLMKKRNTGVAWTADEKKELRTHIRHLSKMVPLVIIFLAPGGTLLIPVLAHIVDRRKKIRAANQKASVKNSSVTSGNSLVE